MLRGWKIDETEIEDIKENLVSHQTEIHYDHSAETMGTFLQHTTHHTGSNEWHQKGTLTFQ